MLGVPPWSVLQVDGNEMCLPRTAHTCTLIPNTEKLVFIGGRTSPEQQLEFALEFTETYDASARTWHRARMDRTRCVHPPPPGTDLVHHASVAASSSLWVLGGFEVNLSSSTTCVATASVSTKSATAALTSCSAMPIWRVDPVDGGDSVAWVEVTGLSSCTGTLPLARGGHSATMLDERRCLVVGGSRSLHELVPADDGGGVVFVLDLESLVSRVVEVPNLHPRYLHAAAPSCSMGTTTVLIHGGYGRSNTSIDKISVNSGGVGRCEAMACSGMVPLPRVSHTLTFFNSRWHLFGGRSPETGAVRGDFARLSSTGTWIRVVPEGHSPDGRHGHTTTCLGNAAGVVVVFGGMGVGGTILNDMYTARLVAMSRDVVCDMTLSNGQNNNHQHLPTHEELLRKLSGRQIILAGSKRSTLD
eukprot:PhM_4_TR7533/c0_g1_i1/m.28169